MSKQALYQFELDCGRSGSLNGLFIAEKSAVAKLMGQRVCFGEVLGKHSEVTAMMDSDMFYVKSEDQELITKLQEVFTGTGSISGFNPFDYYELEEDEDE